MDDTAMMREALNLAQEAADNGEVPVGCVVAMEDGRIVGRGPEILDGSHGVAMQLGRRLAAAGMLRTQGGAGTVEFRNSLDEPEILALSRALLQYRED